MSGQRHKDANWQINEVSYDSAQLAVLMDIRDELKQLNRVLNCRDFLDMPRVLRQVRANTAKPRKKAL